MKITLHSYVSEWPVVFEYEKFLLLRGVNHPGVVVEHIGSTAVPGLSAKPVIDIMLGVPQGYSLDPLVDTIIGLDYNYISFDNQFVPDRLFFTRVDQDTQPGKRIVENQKDMLLHEALVHSHHLYVVHTGSQFWKDHIRFRDHLRTNPSDRLVYELLKKQLAGNDWESMSDYVKAKSDFIRMILSRPSSIL